MNTDFFVNKLRTNISIVVAQENFYHLEKLVLNDGQQHGHMNAASSFQLLECSIASAMGATIGAVKKSKSGPNEVQVHSKVDSGDPNDVGWASEEVQQHFLFGKLKTMQSWNLRYQKLRLMLLSIRGDTPLLHPMANGQYVHKEPKPPVPIILFIVLSLVLATVCAPFLDSAANPEENMKHLHILVADFDGGMVGSSFTSFIQELPSLLNDPLPTFVVLDPEESSPDDLTDRVLRGKGWAG